MTSSTSQTSGARTKAAQPTSVERSGSAALALFDQTADVHNLPSRARRWLAYAAAFLEAARAATPDRADQIGRDMVLAAPIAGLSADEQCIIASVVAFQRDKLRRRREPSFVRLGKRKQTQALQLAALLRLSDVLPSTAGIEVDDQQTVVVLAGRMRAQQRADLEQRVAGWQQVIGEMTLRTTRQRTITPLLNGAAAPEAPTIEIGVAADAVNELRGDEQLSEGARRMLRRLFERMLARQAAVLRNDAPEDVHQMRVATRRLRASLQLVWSLYDAQTVRRFQRELRRVAGALGTVRDLDVFLINLRAHYADVTEDEQVQLGQLIAAAEQRRTQAREALLDELNMPRYARFVRRFATFLTTPNGAVREQSDAPAPPRVRDRVGSMILQRYEQWRAFEVALDDGADQTLHQARIAGKRLRYALEFFADALGKQSEPLLSPLVDLQEELGALQDTVAAHHLISSLGFGNDPATGAYLTTRAVEHERRRTAALHLWHAIASLNYRRRLVEASVML